MSGLLALYLRFFRDVSLILTPLPLLAALTFLTGIICLLMGLMAELLVRVYYESQGKATYIIKSQSDLNLPVGRP